jgi:hypothetical protein
VKTLSVKRYELVTDEALIRLEPSHSASRGFYWLFNLVVAFFDGSMSTETPMDLVIRDRHSKDVVYRDGTFWGAEGVAVAEEAKRVIDVLGVNGYVRRQTS